MIYLCEECLPTVDHFVGPEDPRECACCGKAEQCVEVDPKDLVLTLQAVERLGREVLPSPSAAPLGAPSLPPLAGVPLPPKLPPLPPPGSNGGQ